MDENEEKLVVHEPGRRSVEQAKESEPEVVDHESPAPDREALAIGEEMAKLQGSDDDQVAGHAQQLQSLKDEEKVQELVQLAQKRGVEYAVKVAAKMSDPFLLDRLHDELTQRDQQATLRHGSGKETKNQK